MNDHDKLLEEHFVNHSDKTLGKNISGVRQLKNLSRMKLAEKANIDYSYLGRIERGEVTISHFILLKICLALDVRNPINLYEEIPAKLKQFLKEIDSTD